MWSLCQEHQRDLLKPCGLHRNGQSIAYKDSSAVTFAARNHKSQTPWPCPDLVPTRSLIPHHSCVDLFLVLILVVSTIGQLTRIRCITNAAVLPVVVVHELALEIEGVVDV